LRIFAAFAAFALKRNRLFHEGADWVAASPRCVQGKEICAHGCCLEILRVPESELLLRELLAHPTLGETALGRRRWTYRELTQIQKEERYKDGIAAVQEFPTWQKACDLIRKLGMLKHGAAVPALVRLWEGCRVQPVWSQAGYALFHIGTSEAHAALRRSIELADHPATFLAIQSIIVCDLLAAFDSLRCYFEPDALEDPAMRPIAQEIFRFFGPATWSNKGPGWHHPLSTTLLRDDPRWVELALHLRRDRKLGWSARHLLSTLTREEIDAALLRWPDPPAPQPPVYQGPLNFLARYEAGEYEAVWRELSALGPLEDGPLRREAEAVAEATMYRVRSNVDLVTEQLAEAGYPFDSFAPPWTPPTEDVEQDIRKIETASGGPVPISLRAFWKIVGEVHWKHSEEPFENRPWGQDFPLEEADPLCISSAGNSFWSVEEWLTGPEKQHPEVKGPLLLELAADYLHKANISGGAPYAIELPNRCMDGMFEREEHDLLFIDYLRLCFHHGGFSRIGEMKMSERARQFIDRLRRDLVPF